MRRVAVGIAGLILLCGCAAEVGQTDLTLHQRAVLSPLQPLIGSASEAGLAARLAVAYPTAKKFRTGATLAMYTIVVLVIVLLAQISAVIRAGVDSAVADASGTLAGVTPTARIRLASRSRRTWRLYPSTR